jgi:HEAT repeat protein
LVASSLSGTRFGLNLPPRRTRRWAASGLGRRLLPVAPELPKPDIRPQLRELLAWYDDVLQRIASGALVEPGVAERLSEEREFTARHLELLDADEKSPQATE